MQEIESRGSSAKFASFVLLFSALSNGSSALSQVQQSPENNPIWRMQREMGITPGSQTPEQFRELMEKKQAQQQAQADAWWAGMLAKIQAPAAASPWLEAEKKAFAGMVAMAKPKVLVVPPTVPEGAAGIDISSRITIGRLVARAIEVDAGEVPDPALVYRALGEPRGASLEELRRRFLGEADWLIAGTAQQDGAGKMRVTLSKIALRGTGAPAAFERAGIEISEDRPPELQFAPLASEAARALGYPAARSPQTTAKRSAALVLPASPAADLEEDDTLTGVWMQQLVGVLHIDYSFTLPRQRERVFERTLAALIDVPAAAPDRAVLLARALAYLDRRKAALKVLAAGTGTPEEKALGAYLASDLPGLTAAVAQVKRPAAKLISQLELFALRKSSNTLAQGDLEPELQAMAKSLPEDWHAPVSLYVMGLDLWTLPPAASIKPVLDRTFPVAGYTAEDLVRGKVALGTRSYDQKTGALLSLSPLVHAQKWRAEHMHELCCRTGSAAWMRYGREQYLYLLEADADRLAMAHLEFVNSAQGLHDRALQLANLYDEVLFAGGHTGLVIERLSIAFKLNDEASPEQRARIGVEAFENARKVLTWESSQSDPLAAAYAAQEVFYRYFVTGQGPVVGGMRGLPPLALERDFPLRSLWANRVAESNLRRDEFAMEASRSACDNTVLRFRLCIDHLDKLKSVGRADAVDGAIKSLIEPRFRGNAARYEVLAQRKEELGELGAAQALLAEATRVPNAPSSAYASLGTLLQAQGKFPEAAKAYLSYPGLKTDKENRVGISNYASKAGLGLARGGAPSEGRPLLEVAAANHDGSLSSLRSAAWVAQAAGEYGQSLAILREAYQHYGQAETAGSIAATLFMLGRADTAWSALGDVLPQARGFAPFRAVTVGLRMAGADDNALLNWRVDALQRGSAAAGWAMNDFITMVVFQTASMDRNVGGLDSAFDVRQGRARLPAERRGPPLEPGNRMASATSYPFSLFLNAYVPFRKGDHKSAASEWDKFIRQYDSNATPSNMGNETDTFWAAMPYAALSLAKAGRVEDARRLAERLTPEGRPAGSPKAFPGAAAFRMPAFDRKLIAGISAAFSGKHAEALQAFRGAQGAMEAPGSRLIPPEYAFVELLETVSRETDNAAYKDLALAFARGYQGYEPWAGWAYAFEAEYSRGAGQVRAAALALKFDPKSARLAKLDPKLLDQAREWLRANDPFVEKKEPPAIPQTKS
jgi:hypothetical protein